MTELSATGTPMMVLTGTANPALAARIAEELDRPLCEVTVKRFADGEIFVRIDENVRGRDVFVIQSTNPPAENILELLLLIDAAKRASAARVTAVVPYFGYARQDRKDQPRVSIAGKLLANLIVAAGADRLITIDFHQHQLQGFFDIPVDHLYAAPVFMTHYEGMSREDLVVVATDVGAAKMARGYAKRLGAGLAIMDKRRPSPNEAEVLNVVGDVEGKRCIISDDMVDTAGTMANAAVALRERGAREVYAIATHALLSGPAVERLNGANLMEMAVTDTIAISEEKSANLRNLKTVSVASLLARAIESTHYNRSVSKLFT
ncbi:MAG: ribose-phosphate pyrophosphokinase [Candidatus Palauibacterales bacterium]|nr:ribose-phosphate pyrophosphokinase [Candidatus Palauibacterales bacterium]MDP2482333.1 ribose-phosphate pyrophosphokinase [Candidatus Palauibacterales bacterium]